MWWGGKRVRRKEGVLMWEEGGWRESEEEGGVGGGRGGRRVGKRRGDLKTG